VLRKAQSLDALRAAHDQAPDADARAQIRLKARTIAGRAGKPVPDWAAAGRAPRHVLPGRPTPRPMVAVHETPAAPPTVPEALGVWRTRAARDGVELRAVQVRRSRDRWTCTLVEWRAGDRFEASFGSVDGAAAAATNGAIEWRAVKRVA
jgi:hypothetical protein